MRNYIKLKFLVPIILFSAILESAQAQDQQKSWDYPLRPGMPEWKYLNSYHEMIKACQIPSDILTSISTDQLIDLCTNYPLVLSILGFNSILDGFGKYEKDFNGFQELLRREDVATILVNKYKSEDLLKVEPELALFKDKFGFAMKLSMMELFLCHEQILSKLDHTQKVDLINELQYKKFQKYNSDPVYGALGLQTISLAIILIIESEEFPIDQSIEMDLIYPYIISGVVISKSVFEEVDKVVNNYLSIQN